MTADETVTATADADVSEAEMAAEARGLAAEREARLRAYNPFAEQDEILKAWKTLHEKGAIPTRTIAPTGWGWRWTVTPAKGYGPFSFRSGDSGWALTRKRAALRSRNTYLAELMHAVGGKS